MSKLHYFSNKFFKLTFDFGELKLLDLVKLCFFKRIMTKSMFKNTQLQRHFSNVIAITSFLLRHQNASQDFSFCPPPTPQLKFLATPVLEIERSQSHNRS